MKRLVQRFIWVLFFLIFANATTPEGAVAIDLAWDWYPNGSTFTSGPGGDIVYNLYMREGEFSDYDYDDPLMVGIDDCVLDNDRYSCRVSLDYDFMPGILYYFAIVANSQENPTLRSASSNEVLYYIDPADVQDSDNGCFIDSKIVEFFFGCDTR